MKKKICLALSFLFIFNLFGQEIFTSRVSTENGPYLNGDVEMVLLKKYEIVKNYCIKNYFPMLADSTILAGEDLIGFLDRSNTNDDLDRTAACFTKKNGLNYIVYNGNYFLDRNNMIRITCHELAHFSSDAYSHDDVAYQKEVKRLKSLGIDINTHKDCTIIYDCVRKLNAN